MADDDDDDDDDTPLSNARASLERIQTFDTNTLKRDELGQSFNFQDAVAPAERLIGIFKKVPGDSLSELPDQLLGQIQKQADAVFNLFDQVHTFDETLPEATNARSTIIKNISDNYQKTFSVLMPFISYGVARTVDFQRLETDGRAALQAIKDQTTTVLEELENSKSEASDALDEIKRTAAERGVSQEAYHFATEADEHATKADEWKATTQYWAIGLLAYGVGSFFLHKIPWIAPDGIEEAIIFVASKVLIFAVLTYMLILSARNFLSHKHNAVVNKHRQNALMTFNALVAASKSGQTQDIVLSHAASCIFSPQDTGYTKHGGANSAQMPNAVDLIPKTTVRVDS